MTLTRPLTSLTDANVIMHDNSDSSMSQNTVIKQHPFCQSPTPSSIATVSTNINVCSTPSTMIENRNRKISAAESTTSSCAVWNPEDTNTVKSNSTLLLDVTNIKNAGKTVDGDKIESKKLKNHTLTPAQEIGLASGTGMTDALKKMLNTANSAFGTL